MVAEVGPDEERSLGGVDLDVELREPLHGVLIGGAEPGDVGREVDGVQPGGVLKEAGGHVLHVGGDTGEDAAPVNAGQQAGVVAVDEAHPEARQTEVFAEAPHEVSSLWVRELIRTEGENAVERFLFPFRGEVRESVDLVRYEVDLILGTDPHQLQGELLAVDLTGGIVGVTVEKSSDFLPQLPLRDDGVLQQFATQNELESILL